MRLAPRSVVLIAVLCLVSSACGAGSEDPLGVDSPEEVPAPDTAAPPVVLPEETNDNGEIDESAMCQPPPTYINLDIPLEAEYFGSSQPPPKPWRVCVMILGGVTELSVTVSGLSADLDLYVGSPDLEAFEEKRGEVWSSETRGLDDEVVTIGPGEGGLVEAGPYYIELIAFDYADSTPFTLSMTTISE